jgi:hypothetical protein
MPRRWRVGLSRSMNILWRELSKLALARLFSRGLNLLDSAMAGTALNEDRF